MSDDLGYLGEEVERRPKDRHFPERTCLRCKSYLICLTKGTDGDDVMTEPFLKECIRCEKRVLFYVNGSGGIWYEGGHVLRACLLGTEQNNDYHCIDCRKENGKWWSLGSKSENQEVG